MGRDSVASKAELEAPLRIDIKKLLLLLVIGGGVALLLIRLAGERDTLAVLETARTDFVLLAVLAESMRYVTVGLYTQKLTQFLGHHIPLWSFVELMFAGGSANRIVSAGGAAGIYVRYRFFNKHGLSGGNLAIVLILQNLLTGIILLSTFLLGLSYLISRQLIGRTQLLVAAALISFMVALIAACVGFYLHPRQLKRGLAGVSRLIDVPVRRLSKRRVYQPKDLVRSVRNLYQAVDVARSQPLETSKAFVYGVLTLFSDILCLYFVFHALSFPMRLDVLVVGYVITNYVISILLMPEGIGVTELSLSAVYASLGVPPDVVVVATLGFRFISFWLPIGAGLLAMWDLHRQSLL